MGLSITDLKKGTVFQWEGEPFRVVDYKQKVLGRGGSIVNVRIKSLLDGKVLEKTFKGSEQLDTADVTTQAVQYLYNDGSTFFFMNDETFEQFEVAADLVADGAGYLKEGDRLQLQFFNDRAINVELPKNVPLKVTYQGTAFASNIRARFGYLENGGDLLRCTAYAQDCSTEIPSGASSDPYSFTNETVTRQSCANGAACSVIIPSLPNRMLYYVIDRLDGNGNVMTSSAMQAVAVP